MSEKRARVVALTVDDVLDAHDLLISAHRLWAGDSDARLAAFSVAVRLLWLRSVEGASPEDVAMIDEVARRAQEACND